MRRHVRLGTMAAAAALLGHRRTRLTAVDLAGDADGSLGRDEKASFDLLPDLRATHGWIGDKPEGFTVAADGRAYVVTDNDGVDESSGETQLLRFKRWERLFPTTD